MKITLVAVGTRIPDWVNTAFDDYARRLPHQCALKLVQVPAKRRATRADTDRLLRDEGRALLAAAPQDGLRIALDRNGQQYSTEKLAEQMGHWLQLGSDVTLMVGGPEGLALECINTADAVWSLSALTFPHALVRVIVAEQLYRAWSILNNLPYHRG